MLKRPGAGSFTTTPQAHAMVKLLGGFRDGSVTVTRTEKRNLEKLYGYVPELPREKPPAPVAPEPLKKGATYEERREYDKAQQDHKRAMENHAKWESSHDFLQAGADRNVFRHAQADGVRLMAWIARYVPVGEDPLKTLVQLACDAGYDVDPADVEWAQGESDEEMDEEEDEEEAT